MRFALKCHQSRERSTVFQLGRHKCKFMQIPCQKLTNIRMGPGHSAYSCHQRFQGARVVSGAGACDAILCHCFLHNLHHGGAERQKRKRKRKPKKMTDWQTTITLFRGSRHWPSIATVKLIKRKIFHFNIYEFCDLPPTIFRKRTFSCCKGNQALIQIQVELPVYIHYFTLIVILW